MSGARPGDLMRRRAGDAFGAEPEVWSRYGASLDLLSKRIWPYLQEHGIEPNCVTDGDRRRLLSGAASWAISACYQAAEWIGREHLEPRRTKSRRASFREKDAEPLARAADRLAGALRDKVPALRESISALLLRLPGLCKNCGPADIAGAMEAFAAALRRGSFDTRPDWSGAGHRFRHFNLMVDGPGFDVRSRLPSLGTCLGFELVYCLRVATGGPNGWHTGEPMPKRGRPCYSVAASFIEAALGDGEPLSDPLKLRKRIETMVEAGEIGGGFWPEVPRDQKPSLPGKKS